MRARWILLPLLILMLAVAGVGAQQDGRTEAPSFLERQLQSLVPGLQVEGLEGAWRAAPRARRMTLSDSQGVWLVIEGVRLNIAPTALIRGVLRLEGLEADSVTVERLPVADPNAPTPAPSADAGVLPSLPDLPVDVALDKLSVARLSLAEPVLGQAASFALDGRGRLGEGRLTAQLDLRRLDGDAHAAVDIALDPPQDRLTAKVTLREAARGLVPTLVGYPQYPLALDLTLDGPATTGAALTLDGRLGPEIGLEAKGTVRAGGDGMLGAVLDGVARAAPLLPPDVAPLASPVHFALDAAKPGGSDVLTFSRLTLELPAGQLGVTGTLDIAREVPDLTATLAVADSARFAALLPPGLAFTGAAAEARITGTLAAPKVALNAQPQGLATGAAQADAVLGPAPRVSGTVAMPGPALDLALDGAAGKLGVQGSLTEPVDVTARVSLPDLAVLGTGSTGALEAEAHATGSLTDPTMTVNATSGRIAASGRALDDLRLAARIETPRSAPRAEATMTATLDGTPLRLAVNGQPEGATGLRLTDTSLRVGDDLARAVVTGLLDTAALVFTGDARVEAKDLARLGRIAGVDGLAGRLTLAASLAPKDGTQGFDARLDAPLLGFGGNAVAGLTATAAGTPDALRFDVQGRGGGALPLGPFSTRGSVATIPEGRRLEVAALEAQVNGERLRLAGPARVTLGQDGGVEIAPLTVIAAEAARVQAQGRWGPERADITADVTALNLATAGRFAPGVEPTGTLSGQVRVTGTTAKPEVRVTVQGQRLASGAPWAHGLPPVNLRAEARMDPNGSAEAQATIEAGTAGRITASAKLPRGFGADATVTATANGSLDLAPLAAPFLAAGADRVTGRVTLALGAEGPLTAPRPTGRVTLSNISYRNGAQGIRVSDINGAILADGMRFTLQDIRGRTSGGGTITIAGSIDPTAPGIGAAVTVTARNARPVTSPLGTGAFNADLRLTGPLLEPGGSLSGRVAILGAELRIPETLPASVPVLTDVRTRGAPPPGALPPPSPPPPGAAPQPAGPALPLALAITVVAERPIFVRGRGIEAELGGEVRVGGTLAQPVPSGGMTLRRGTLNILARQLTFQRGSISFSSGTLMPVLDLAAVSRTRSATITVKVQGSPANPEITFSSSPELPQDEVLSRLLFDRATSNLSPFEIAQLAQAVAQLTGVSTGPDVLDKLRGALGLDRLGVTSDSAGRAALEAGRYVAPGVFLGVRQGVQGQTGVGVQVELTPQLRLEGQTATGPAGDRIGLSYELEY